MLCLKCIQRGATRSECRIKVWDWVELGDGNKWVGLWCDLRRSSATKYKFYGDKRTVIIRTSDLGFAAVSFKSGSNSSTRTKWPMWLLSYEKRKKERKCKCFYFTATPSSTPSLFNTKSEANLAALLTGIGVINRQEHHGKRERTD